MQRFDRIRRASSLTVFQVDGYHPHCYSWTFPADRVIDCHPIIQQVEAPSAGWRDSLVNLLTTPGALIPPQASLCICNDDVVLRFAAGAETTTIWLCTSCGTFGMPTPGAIIGFQLTIPPELLRRKLYGVLSEVEYESRFEFLYHDTPPILSSVPRMPPELELRGNAAGDTVRFEVRVGTDGRVREILPKRAVHGIDSLAADYVKNYRYRPALSRGRAVIAWSVIELRVPRTR